MKQNVLSIVIVCLMTLASAVVGKEKDTRRILKDSGVVGGLVVHLGCGTGETTAALRISDATTVHGLDRDPATVHTARVLIQTLSETDHKRVTFEELYDKDKDPAEMTNLLTSEERPAILKTLKAEIKQHRANVLER